MDWREWFGFSRPRDAPERELPKIEDNVRDSGGIFVFGQTLSGERVDEKSAMQIATVYACVRLLAETVASLPLHLYKFTEKGDGKEKATEHPLYKILYRQANPEMTSFSFREAMMTHLLLWGNAYAQIVRDGKNGILGLYPLLPENVEIDRAEKRTAFLACIRFSRKTWRSTGQRMESFFIPTMLTRMKFPVSMIKILFSSATKFCTFPASASMDW